MGDGFGDRATTLAAAAHALNSKGGRDGAPMRLAFMTDRARLADPIAVARALPAGAAVILRDYDDPMRRETARALALIARKQDLLLFVGGDPALARDVGAGGIHLRSDQLRMPVVRDGLLLSASCHTLDELECAGAIGADIAILGPVFPTKSHPGTAALGAAQFKALAAAAPIPVLGVGGVDETNAALIAGPNVAGFAAIGAFARAAP